MTLISSIMLDAFRESNIIPLGKDPTANQVTEAFRLYTAIINSIYGGDAGERLEDWPLGTFDRDPNEWDFKIPLTDDRLRHPTLNRRLIAVNLNAETIWLATRPQDGARMGIADPFSRLDQVPITIDGNGRPIEGAASIILNTPGTFREWFYRADLAAWVRLTDLQQTDDNPFPAAYDTMFIVLLAARLNPRYGRQLDPLTDRAFKQNYREFVARYLQSQPLEIDESISWPFMSRQSYDTQRAFSTTRGFQRGNYPG